MALTSATSTEGRRWQWLTRAPGLLLQSVHDPGHTSLRRGLRAGLVVPLLLAAAMVAQLGAPFTTFLVFGAMALLVFADFGGKARPRVLAYVLTALAGVPLIVIGTLASNNVGLAVGATALVAFVLSGMGVLGGYFLSAQTALMLAYVLSVSSASGVEVLPDRVMGWLTAGVISTLAGWLIWPRSSHVALYAQAASVIRTVAATVSAPDQNTPHLQQLAREELTQLEHGFVVAQRRPSGATRRDRALAELATELDRALTFAASAPPVADSNVAAADEAAVLRTRVVRALEASANLLEGASDADVIDPLISARDEHRSGLDRWAAAELQAGAAPASVLDGLVSAHPLRLMSMVALAIAENAEVAAGLPPSGLEHASRRDVWSTFVEEFNPSSVWLRNSLRTGLGVALAVLVARTLALPYAFWVVLGTLSALRSNVSSTGRSALQALAGTMVGVLIAVPFVGATGHEPWVLWIVLPILVFLAAYTPAAVHFVVGQAAFSVLVVV
ncbi:MAG TPA: FUSC family protein, partial [Chloroflexota bacterium]